MGFVRFFVPEKWVFLWVFQPAGASIFPSGNPACGGGYPRVALAGLTDPWLKSISPTG